MSIAEKRGSTTKNNLHLDYSKTAEPILMKLGTQIDDVLKYHI